MDIIREQAIHLKRTFTDESYMNPDPTSIKYKGRNPEIGKTEAERRLKFMPEIEAKSAKVLGEMGYPPSTCPPKDLLL